MSIASTLWRVWRHGDLGFCLKLFEKYQEVAAEGDQVNSEMKRLGLVAKNMTPMLHSLCPASHIGAAMQLANYYSLEFDIGTTMYDCRAILWREKWQREINKNISLESLAFFTIPKTYDEIESIQGISDRIEVAICKCLIQARIAGVI